MRIKRLTNYNGRCGMADTRPPLFLAEKGVFYLHEDKKSMAKTALSGVVVGSSMLIPGVSGGTTAIMLGIYDRLVRSISGLRRHPKESLLFLGLFCLGGGAGMLLFSRLALFVVEQFAYPAQYFFTGAILGSLPLLIKKSTVRHFTPGTALFGVVGFLLVLALRLVPKDLFVLHGKVDVATMLLLAFTGVIIAVALVLPGISASHMLLLLGLYQMTLKAIGDFYLPFLIPLGLGGIAGIFLCTAALERAMDGHPQQTYMLIVGFVAASVMEVFPGLPGSVGLWFICPLCLVAGALLIYWVSGKFGQ